MEECTVTTRIENYYQPYSIYLGLGTYLKNEPRFDPEKNSTSDALVSKGVSAAFSAQVTFPHPSLAHLISGGVLFKTYRGEGSDKQNSIFFNSSYLFSISQDDTSFLGPYFGLRSLPLAETQGSIGFSLQKTSHFKFTASKCLNLKKDFSLEIELRSGFIKDDRSDKLRDPVAFQLRLDRGYNRELNKADLQIALGFKIFGLDGWGFWLGGDTGWKDQLALGFEKTSFEKLSSPAEKKNNQIIRLNKRSLQTIAEAKELFTQMKNSKNIDQALLGKAAALIEDIDELLKEEFLYSGYKKDLAYLRTLLLNYSRTKN